MEKIIHHIRKHVHKIRKQPEQVKRSILHVTTVICAVILAALWVYSLGVTLTDQDTQAKIGNDLEPFSALKDNLVGGYHSLSTPAPEANGETQ